MARVRELPPRIANQIAAGEVVERPASVVRELVENAIDAGAGAISVAVQGSGRRRIRVTDDGIGMSPEDARAALLRHATSKIESIDDLDAIGSLGFRGEALPAIASVSRFRLRTREKDADAGWEIAVEAGRTVEERPAGMAPGADVDVRDLFFSTPARRKFLKADRTETAHVVAAVQHLAAAWPQIRFVLTADERPVLRVEPVADAEARMRQIEPRWSSTAIASRATEGPFSVRALLSPPMAPRGASSRLVLFVNGRPIRDRRLFHAVTEAYRAVSSLSGVPKAYVFIDAPPETVDVNVHPAKAEVRFADGGAAHDAVFRAVRAALGGSPKQVRVAPPEQVPAAPGAAYRRATGGAADGDGGGPAREVGSGFASVDGREVGEMLYGRSGGSEAAVRGYLDFGEAVPEVLGQFGATYILAAADGQALLIVDQHAAHERILFNRLMDREAPPASLRLLDPVPLEVSPAERLALEAERERLAPIGFDVEPFGGDAFVVRAVPDILGARRGLEALHQVLAAGEGECAAASVRDRRARTLATVACHAAVTAGTPLGPDALRPIVADLWRTRDPATCPHGRPTVLRLDLPFLERRFGRR